MAKLLPSVQIERSLRIEVHLQRLWMRKTTWSFLGLRIPTSISWVALRAFGKSLWTTRKQSVTFKR